MNNFRQDVRFALRAMRKSPGFTAVAVITLAAGIGANTAIFTVLNAVFLHPLNVVAPERVVQIFTTDQRNRGGSTNYLPVSHPNGEDVRARSQSLSSVALYSPTNVSVTIGGHPERLTAHLVSGTFFDVLGIHAMLGRTFLPGDDGSDGSGPVVVLSYGVWQRKFGSDTALIGKDLLLNGQRFTIVGVTPRGFQGTTILGGPDMWIPLSMHNQVFSGFQKTYFNERRFLAFSMVARLKDGVSLEQVRSELHALGADLEREFPAPNAGRNFVVIPLLQSSIDPNSRALYTRAGGLMMTVVGLVLLIACANIANLLLSRAASRKREIAIRLALGASRKRIITQLLTEALILAALGGGLGMVMAVMGRNFLWRFRPPALLDSYLNLALDGKVLLFSIFLSIGAGLLFGLAPALQSSRPDLVTELKQRVGEQAWSGRRFGLRQAFIVLQVALSMVALAGAGIFLLSLYNAQQTNPGFDTTNLAMLTFDMGSLNYDTARMKVFEERVLETAEAVPGVTSATLTSSVPLLNLPFGRTVSPEGEEGTSVRNGVLVQIATVSPGYLRTMGIPLIEGQDFDTSVREDSQRVAVVNESAARRFWPNQYPVGRRFKFFGDNNWIQVVGVARDSKYNSLGEDPIPFLYLPVIQNPSPQLTLFFRSRIDAGSVLNSVRARVQALDNQLPLTNVWPIGQVISQGLWAARFSAGLLSIFALLALLLCAVGIHGVVGYTVGQRIREIGIRLALGARPRDVLLMILRQSASTLGIGLVTGITAAVLLTRLIVNLLYGVKATQPLAFLITAAILTAVGLLASYLPARRALKVDPKVALHE